MAKDKKTATEEVATTDKNNTAVAEVPAQPTREEQMAALKNMQKGKEDSGYLTFEAGLEVNVIFLGWKEIPGKGVNADKMVPACVFMTDEGEKINADSANVSYFQKQTEGCARVIVCTGTKTTANGTYKTFKWYEGKPQA